MVDKWHIKHAGLFTFAESIKHIHLYQNFGFWPRFLTSVMSKTIDLIQEPEYSQWARYSEMTSNEKTKAIEDCTHLTDQIYNGMNLEREINSVEKQGLDDTILLRDDNNKSTNPLIGMAICYCGPSTEAGSGTC